MKTLIINTVNTKLPKSDVEKFKGNLKENKSFKD